MDTIKILPENFKNFRKNYKFFFPRNSKLFPKYSKKFPSISFPKIKKINPKKYDFDFMGKHFQFWEYF